MDKQNVVQPYTATCDAYPRHSRDRPEDVTLSEISQTQKKYRTISLTRTPRRVEFSETQSRMGVVGGWFNRDRENGSRFNRDRVSALQDKMSVEVKGSDGVQQRT